MGRNLAIKAGFVAVVVVLALWTLIPPTKTLKPGIDLAGGASLIYEIDAQGLEAWEKKDLSSRMITVLRRRIDPANIQNLIWRPQGGTRFEIQMPLASAEARQKRENYESAVSALLGENVNRAKILRSMRKEAEQRQKDFKEFAENSAEKLTILENFAAAYDEREALRKERDRLGEQLKTPESLIQVAGIDLEKVKMQIGKWTRLNDQELTEALKEFLGSPDNVELLTNYVKMYSDWAKVAEQLADPEGGKNTKYREAEKALDKLNLTEEQLKFVLEMPVKSSRRAEEIQRLKTEFSDRADKIDKVAAAFDEYRPYKGRLDDPRDLKRMLKGAGVLEFRILPTVGHPEVDTEEMNRYVETLKAKGPKYASDNKYVWCEIEKINQWAVADQDKRPSIVAQFGDKFYVLGSNKANEALLHRTSDQKGWKLESARPSQDDMGRRAIGFTLNEKGGKLFSEVTGKNIGRPLCILLDGIAISAPNIQSRIRTQGIITGSFAQTEVEDMVNKLNAGSLPARLIEQPVSEKTIGPSIGADNRDQGIRAGLIGLAAVAGCMAVYYLLAGAIADFALLLNILLTLSIMVVLRATFTLPGIAGLILTIGMSVDANVLIYERIREEQRQGSSLRIAIANGYKRAFRTILDSNLTTLITAAILYWVASEEIKGFALVLMLGIGSSMFTALFVTRVIYDLLLTKRILKTRLVMLQLIREGKINWMGLQPVFLTISAVLIVGGLAVFFTRDETKNSKYDIEFTGGTSVQIDLKTSLSRDQVESIIRKAGEEVGSPGLSNANIYSIGKTGKQYEINTAETNKTSATITFSKAGQHTIETVASAIRAAQAKFHSEMSNLRIQALNSPAAFRITTTQLNTSLVKNILADAFADAEVSEPEVDEVVNDAILKAFAGKLEIQENLVPEIISAEKITEEFVQSYPELADYLGGVKISCRIQKAVTKAELNRRFANLWFKPDLQDLSWYSHMVLGADLREMEPAFPVESFTYVSVDPEAAFRELTEEEWTRFVENEKHKVLTAAELETSLPRVTQIDPSVGKEAKTRALIAIVLSLFAIVAYIWVRFGNVRYGIAAIVALVHDVCITLGAVTVCTYLAKGPIGETLLIGDFKIDLAMIAAFLTLIGYSLNDTIVVFDRIRENRRKATLNAKIITDSINQTLSRTIMTGFTTFLVVIIMYIFGSSGLRGFNFAMALGIIVGTYSSIAIAAPLLLIGRKGDKANK